MSVLMTDRVSIRGPAHFIQNDTRTQIVWFTVNRYNDGVDLAQLAWSIHFRNADGLEDVSAPFETPDVRGGKIIVGWLVKGSATDAVGDLTFNLRGVGTDNDGNPLRWSGGDEKRPVYAAQESAPGGEQVEAITELDALIMYVANELPKVIEAKNAAEAAAEAAYKAVENVNEAVDEAIEQAKADGEFKGEPGDPGPRGEKGESGVYVGTEEPTDPDMRVWINPDGQATPGSGSGGIVVEVDPTVPAWAKQPNKPKYTAEEVGAASKGDVEQLSKEVADKQPKGDYALKSEIPDVPEPYTLPVASADTLGGVKVDGFAKSWLEIKDGALSLYTVPVTYVQYGKPFGTLYPDNVTDLFRDFRRFGPFCMFTYQFRVNTAIEDQEYGFVVAELPYSSVSRIWLNNATAFYVDGAATINIKGIRVNNTRLNAGAYVVSGIYFTTDEVM